MPSESVTRKEIIDVRLKEAGWDVADPTLVLQEWLVPSGLGGRDERPTDDVGSREFTDYILLGRNGKPLAVVEAKRSCKDAELGREQAKQYCASVQAREGGEL